MTDRISRTGTIIDSVELGTVKTTGQLFFDIDLYSYSQADYSSTCRLQISLDVSAIIDITLDGGTSWYSLNEGNTLNGGCLYEFFFDMIKTDQLNIRTNTGTVTINLCRVSIY